jgi:hypothetical protein
MKRQYDVLSVADHFLLVTTVIMDEEPDQEVIKQAAWKRMSDEYGDEWVYQTKKLINQTSIEPALMDWADAEDDSDVYTIPEPGDPEDAGIDRD